MCPRFARARVTCVLGRRRGRILTAVLAPSISQGAWPRTCYFLVSHAVSGILHVQITLSHFSMDVTEKPQYR